eukprot:4315463-Pyramimonas_sp.AAC.1
MDRQLNTGPFDAASEAPPLDGRAVTTAEGDRAPAGLALPPTAAELTTGSWKPSRAACSLDTATSSRSNARRSRSKLRTWLVHIYHPRTFLLWFEGHAASWEQARGVTGLQPVGHDRVPCEV